jgi:hypothetical protein
MNVQIEELIARFGLKEPLYPGKKLVQIASVGEFKSHCVVYDWRDPEQLRIEIKAGTTGRDLPLKELQKYPVSFQSPTHVVIEIAEEEEEEGRKGKAGSGSRKPKKKTSLEGFLRVAEGKIPALGKITEMVVMGKEVAAEAYDKVFETFANQIEKMKISPTDLLAKAGNFVTKYTPPAFLQPKGDEQAQYQYNREKIEPMFGIGGG